MALKTYPGDSKREGKKSLKIKRSFIVGLTIYFALLVNDCATFKKPVTINAALIQDRAQSGHFQEEAEPRLHQGSGAYAPDLADIDSLSG